MKHAKYNLEFERTPVTSVIIVKTVFTIKFLLQLTDSALMTDKHVCLKSGNMSEGEGGQINLNVVSVT